MLTVVNERSQERESKEGNLICHNKQTYEIFPLNCYMLISLLQFL